jgi:hypothetical protein
MGKRMRSPEQDLMHLPGQHCCWCTYHLQYDDVANQFQQLSIMILLPYQATFGWKKLKLASVENGDTWGGKSHHGSILDKNTTSTSRVCRVAAVDIVCKDCKILRRFSFWIELSVSWETKQNWSSESKYEDLDMRKQRDATWRFERKLAYIATEHKQSALDWNDWLNNNWLNWLKCPGYRIRVKG